MARKTNRLGTAKDVALLTEPGWYSNGGGLYLRIRKAGGRSWVLISHKNGVRQERGLGGLEKVSLAQARALRKDPGLIERLAVPSSLRPLLAPPSPPVAAAPAPAPARKAAPEKAAKAVPTFGEFTDEILADLLPGFKSAKHRQQWENTLKTHGKPLRKMKIDAVDTDAVLAVLRPLWSRKSETASRLRGRIARILGAAKAKGLRPHDSVNPAAWEGHLEHFLPKRKKLQRGHHASVPWGEMPAFWAVLGARRNAMGTEALRFTILTAARTSEVTGATWREVDLEAGVWTVPNPTTPEADRASVILHVGQDEAGHWLVQDQAHGGQQPFPSFAAAYAFAETERQCGRAAMRVSLTPLAAMASYQSLTGPASLAQVA